MTYNELVDPYLKSLGVSRKKDCGTVEVVLPYIIMDVEYQMYCKVIRPLECKYLLSASKKEWAQAYNKFNQPFFKAYRNYKNEEDVIISLMDSMGSYIERDILVAKISVMNVLMDNGYHPDVQDVIATCYVCDALAKAALVQIERTFGITPKCDSLRRNLKAISHHSILFGKEYVGGQVVITDKREEAIEKSFDVLVRKIVKWVFQEAPAILENHEDDKKEEGVFS